MNLKWYNLGRGNGINNKYTLVRMILKNNRNINLGKKSITKKYKNLTTTKLKNVNI